MKKTVKVLFVPALMAAMVFTSMASAADKGAPSPSAKKASIGDEVEIGYKFIVEGVVVESSDSGGPLVFIIGKNQVIKGLEKAVIGMKKGEAKKFTLPPEEAYGEYDPAKVVLIPKNRIAKGVKLKVGSVVGMKTAEGKDTRVKIMEIREKTVMVDMNHPLSGHSIDLEISVSDIRK